jgi:hypothetical protein
MRNFFGKAGSIESFDRTRPNCYERQCSHHQPELGGVPHTVRAVIRFQLLIEGSRHVPGWTDI